ncbi:hypothetical protein IQ07DRAFT_501528 [Pyrenochaeta sp. DS3sAY3a]|nr:hypothetical protein IQ07DRAFT_501528 [Pyrenochaeta sp. DS3sAY3a]
MLTRYRPPKKKGNPIITRYPPPPNYRGPAQPPGPFGTSYPNHYQAPQPGYPQGLPAPSNYPPQGYTGPLGNQAYNQTQPSNYPQPSYPQGQNYQWPQQGYPPNQGYSQNPAHPPVQGYAPPQPQHNYQQYPPQPALGPNQQNYSHLQSASWQSQDGQVPHPSSTQYKFQGGPQVALQPTLDPNATPTPASVHLAMSQSAQLPGQPPSATSENGSVGKSQLFLAWDDWDYDFDGAIWPKSNEPVDPNLSLGVIIWHPAKQMTRALPSAFAEAEYQASQPTPEKLDNGESVSMYFTAENSHEAFLDVRQTDEWYHIRDDPVFVVFSDEEMRDNLVSLEDCIAQRDRPDEPLEASQQDEDQEMHDATYDIMGNLEQALSGGRKNPSPLPTIREKLNQQKETQEDILAKLGVTGAPKPPSSVPLPISRSASLGKRPLSVREQPRLTSTSTNLPNIPPPPPRAQSYSSQRGPTHGSPPSKYGSMSSVPTRIPPPPPPPMKEAYDPWNAPRRNEYGFNSSRASPAPSEGSNHTMAGSDFESEKPSTGTNQETPNMPLKRSNSSFARKRSYEDADHGSERTHQHDDNSKRKRRTQVDAAYR